MQATVHPDMHAARPHKRPRKGESTLETSAPLTGSAPGGGKLAGTAAGTPQSLHSAVPFVAIVPPLPTLGPATAAAAESSSRAKRLRGAKSMESALDRYGALDLGVLEAQAGARVSGESQTQRVDRRLRRSRSQSPHTMRLALGERETARSGRCGTESMMSPDAAAAAAAASMRAWTPR